MDKFYRESIYRGKQPFQDTILVVDEVDDLIVEDEPNSFYTAVERDQSKHKLLFEIFINNPNSPNKPMGVSDLDWDRAKRAVHVASSMKLDVDYFIDKSGSRYYFMVRGKTYYNMSVEYLSFKHFGVDPRVKTTFYIQSKPYMLSQYDAIVGFSGSLGSKSETEFLRSTYKATCFKVPPFLDTCNGTRKHPPDLVDNCIYIADNALMQYKRIEATVSTLFFEKRVPILVICENEMEANQVFSNLEVFIRTNASRFPPGTPFNELVQRFAQYNVNREQDLNNYGRIVEKATTKFPTSDRDFYPITVTEPFGGRGHDYMTNEESVDSAGGLAVIITSIPLSERDWTQWKGRTARNDRRGQYSVVLRKDAKPVSDEIANISSYQSGQNFAGTDKYDERVISMLQNRRDRENEGRMRSLKETVTAGCILNEFCDRFYQAYGGVDEQKWPANQDQEELRDLLEFYFYQKNAVSKDKLVLKVRNAAVATRLVVSEKDYKSAYF
jgi:hypothetical protein